MDFIGSLGFSVATFAYFAFFLLLAVIRKKSFIAIQITFVSLVSIVACAIAALQVKFGFSLKNVLIAENLKLLSYLMLLVNARIGISSFSNFFNNKSCLKYAIVGVSLSLGAWYLTESSGAGNHYLFLLFLVLNLAVIVALEQLYRNSIAKVKWALWPMVIGIGTICVVDFVIFAQAAMLGQLDFDFWYARGYIIAVGVPFFLITSRRVKDWQVDVFISRDVVFYSSMLFIAGSYLLVLATAGYVINWIGGEWGGVFSIAFAALGIAVLIALLLTERLRREVKVFITKHFFANKYDYRVEWLKSLEQLAIRDNNNFYSSALNIICSSMNIHRGLMVKCLGNESFKLLADKEFDTKDLELSKLRVIAEYCDRTRWIVDIREYRFIEDSYPQLDLDIDFFQEQRIDVVIPIISAGKLYGLFLLSRGDDTNLLNWEDRDLLFAITKQLSHYLSLNEANIELSESKQFEAFHRMSAFLVHDLKNVQAQLALINSNAEKHRNNPAFIDDVFETVESATERLDKVLTQLRNKQVPETHDKFIASFDVINQVVSQRNVNKPRVHAEINRELVSYVNEELISVLNHLVQNAQEASEDGDEVTLTAAEVDGCLHISVIDKGCGMSELFMKQRLFKPFDTTKGNAGMGIGAYEAKQFAEGLGGELTVHSVENEGSTFKLTIPIKNN